MTIVTLNKTTFVALNAAAARAQILGGRIQLADVISPAQDDWFNLTPGATFDMTGLKFARALDNTATVVVVLTA